jgi:hypothetical protein
MYTAKLIFIFKIRSDPGKLDIVTRINDNTVRDEHNQIKLYFQD